MKSTRNSRKSVADIANHLQSGVYLKEYNRAEVADFVRRHPADLSRQQRAIIADLIEGKIKYARHGWRSRLGSTERETLAQSILWLAEAHRRRGSKNPIKAAIKEYASRERKDEGTVKRYYIDGRRRLGPAALRNIERLIGQWEGD